jgi:hypothetical protein
MPDLIGEIVYVSLNYFRGCNYVFPGLAITFGFTIKNLFMKKIITPVLAATFCLLSLAGCTKKSSSTSSTGSETATVAGTAFSSAACYETSAGGAFYMISAGNGSVTIGINIMSSSITAGTYAFDSTGTTNSASYTNGSGTKTAKSGSVTITSVTAGANVVGTFSFTCTDGTAITNGKFTAIIK